MHFDIIIVGGGIVGLTQALMFAEKTSLSVLILEKKSTLPSWSENTYHPRVSAITLASKNILTHLQVWPEIIKKRYSPFTGIKVWQGQHSTHLTEMHFDSREINEAYLGSIVENNLLQTVLYEKLISHPQVTLFSDVDLKKVHCCDDKVEIIIDHQKKITAKLAIAADGAHSWLRNAAGINIEKYDYEECALVTQVETELSHEQIARQVFLKTGPLAFLPLASPHLSSIVWTLPAHLANDYLPLSKENLQEKLRENFSFLGKIISISDCHLFPLYKQQAKQYVHERIVLIGDAAHTIHPLAGLGVNMGLLDAAVLLDVILHAIQKNKDFSKLYYLRRYERARLAGNATLMVGIDAIKTLFSSPSPSLQKLISYAFSAAHVFPWLKNIFSCYAAGKRSDLPMLARKMD